MTTANTSSDTPSDTPSEHATPRTPDPAAQHARMLNLLGTISASWTRAALIEVLGMHSPDTSYADEVSCQACGVDTGENPIPWPCAEVHAILAALGRAEADTLTAKLPLHRSYDMSAALDAALAAVVSAAQRGGSAEESARLFDQTLQDLGCQAVIAPVTIR